VPFIQPRHDDACAYARTQADTSAEEVRCAAQRILRIHRLYVLGLFCHLLVHLTTRIHTAEVIHISMAEIIGLQYQILQLDGEAGDAGAVTARASFHGERHTYCRFSIPPVPVSVAHIPQSLMAVIIILLMPAMTPQPPKRVLALRPHERKIVLTEEQGTFPISILPHKRADLKFFPEQNPPRLPLPSTLPSPTVGLARRTRMRRCGVLPTVVEEGSGEGAVCAGW
jgi:hypothetical protein